MWEQETLFCVSSFATFLGVSAEVPGEMFNPETIHPALSSVLITL